MATPRYSRLADGHPSRHGPIPTVVYVCEPDPSTAKRLAERCRTHAAQRAWRVVDTIIEGTPDAPLEEREGWKRVTAALAAGSVGIVVTWQPESVASDPAGFQALQAAFRDRDAVLVAVTGAPGAPPARD